MDEVYFAIQENDLVRVREFIQQGRIRLPPPPKKCDYLQYAARCDSLDVFKELITIFPTDNEYIYQDAIACSSWDVLEYGFTHLNWNPNHVFSDGESALDVPRGRTTRMLLIRHGALISGSLNDFRWLQPLFILILLAREEIPTDVLRYLRPFIIHPTLLL
jgi:hypothetical protein